LNISLTSGGFSLLVLNMVHPPFDVLFLRIIFGVYAPCFSIRIYTIKYTLPDPLTCSKYGYEKKILAVIMDPCEKKNSEHLFKTNETPHGLGVKKLVDILFFHTFLIKRQLYPSNKKIC
jgi:hypothetical protein